jgi:hypothetical protein
MGFAKGGIVKSPVSCLLLSVPLLISSPSVLAQSTPATTDVEQLKSIVGAQQKALEQQQTEIQKLQSQLAEQQQLLIGVVQNGNSNPRLMPAVDRTVDLRAGDPYPQTTPNAQGQPAPQAEELTLEQEEDQQAELERGPEIADPKPDTPALNLGPAKLRILGYPSMTVLYRSTNSGGNVGTSFAGLPFGNAWQGNTSEFRISPQSTRLALRADLSVGDTKAAGYFEMDFGGSAQSGQRRRYQLELQLPPATGIFRLAAGQMGYYWRPGVFADDSLEEGHHTLAGRRLHHPSRRYQLCSGPGMGPLSAAKDLSRTL